MIPTPHKDKLDAAIGNPKCPASDKKLLEEAMGHYTDWIRKMNRLTSTGRKRVEEMVELLNWYKDTLEVEVIMQRGSDFLRRQKGQLKLDNSVLEEFLIHLIRPEIITGMDNLDRLVIGPQNAFMSLAFFPRSVKELTGKPNIFVKSKDQDFVVGTKIHFKFSTDSKFPDEVTERGELVIAVLAAELKVNLDKTMFQEAAGTASRLKQGVPVARYYVLAEYLDMTPEDCRLTAIDNVFLLRRAKRLPFEKRNNPKEVEAHHKRFPIDANVVWKFVQEIQSFADSILFDPESALQRGSFV